MYVRVINPALPIHDIRNPSRTCLAIVCSEVIRDCIAWHSELQALLQLRLRERGPTAVQFNAQPKAPALCCRG